MKIKQAIYHLEKALKQTTAQNSLQVQLQQLNAVKTRHSNKYYSKSSRKGSRTSSTADYKTRVYMNIKVTAKCHSHRECKKDSSKCRKYSTENLGTSDSKGRYTKL